MFIHRGEGKSHSLVGDCDLDARMKNTGRHG